MSIRSITAVAVLALMAAMGGFWLHRHVANNQEPLIGSTMPTGIRLNDLDGKSHVLDQDWRGKLLIINFWASWCGPCLEEMPDLAKAQTQYGARGLQILGPAVDDPDAARQTVQSLKLSYPILIATPETMLNTMRSLGNDAGGLPFSVIVAPDGSILDRRLGAITPDEIDQLVRQNLHP